MKRAVAIRHVHFEDCGVFASTIEAAGYALSILDAGLDPIRLGASHEARDARAIAASRSW